MSQPHMDQTTVRDAIARTWAGDVIPSLSGLVAIPALSPQFDASWHATGQLRAAADHVGAWAGSRDLAGARHEVVELDGRSPLLLIDVPATDGAAGQGTVLLYGHLDKQPALGEWSEGLAPWRAVRRDGRLYGRGSADDGYSGYAAVTALEAVRAAGGRHSRAVVLLETGEESGSQDLPAYLEHLADRLGEVSLVICLDSGGSDYQRLWLTTSLRGMVMATVTVRVLETGVHSGIAGGIVPSSFRIMRQLLDRVEDSATGEVKLPEMNVPIPAQRRADAAAFAALDPDAVGRNIPFVTGMSAASPDLAELILNNTWRPALSVIGGDGLPESTVAPAVLLPSTSLRLSFRTPPTADVAAAEAALVKTLTTDVPYGARVDLTNFITLSGWSAPAPSPWLSAALDELTGSVFSEPYRQFGLGGGIPFMELLGRRYPDADFVVTGALGMDSNMHVPDESLNLEYAEQVTAAVARILDAHARFGPS
jgi:acetylornithine deacetylase/succinyl-diaminopimelate desuccinylase-like protein